MTVLRLCLDLNVWVAFFLATAGGRSGTAVQAVVDAVRLGRSAAGPVQLVVSHTMLSRLHDVLLRKGASNETATQLVSLIHAFAVAGPTSTSPYVVLGGGVLPTRDALMRPYDPYAVGQAPPQGDSEDGRVLDTAVAGRAHALVTANFKDFVFESDEIIVPGRVHRKTTSRGTILIVRPREMAVWLRTGVGPSPP